LYFDFPKESGSLLNFSVVPIKVPNYLLDLTPFPFLSSYKYEKNKRSTALKPGYFHCLLFWPFSLDVLLFGFVVFVFAYEVRTT